MNALNVDAFTADCFDSQSIDLGYKQVQKELKAYKEKYQWHKRTIRSLRTAMIWPTTY